MLTSEFSTRGNVQAPSVSWDTLVSPWSARSGLLDLLNFMALIEFNSTFTSVYESSQTVARADFNSVTWTASNFYPIEGGGMGFNFTLNSPLQIVNSMGAPSYVLGAGVVVLIVRAYNNTQTIETDFVLKAWPFQSTSDKLALQVDLHSGYNQFELFKP